MSENGQYGRHYWGVKVTPDVSSDGEIFVMADSIRVTGSGALELVKGATGGQENVDVNVAIPEGKWLAVFAASQPDGRAVAIERWNGKSTSATNGKHQAARTAGKKRA